jgi:hypothetical protein
LCQSPQSTSLPNSELAPWPPRDQLTRAPLMAGITWRANVQRSASGGLVPPEALDPGVSERFLCMSRLDSRGEDLLYQVKLGPCGRLRVLLRECLVPSGGPARLRTRGAYGVWSGRLRKVKCCSHLRTVLYAGLEKSLREIERSQRWHEDGPPS